MRMGRRSECGRREREKEHECASCEEQEARKKKNKQVRVRADFRCAYFNILFNILHASADILSLCHSAKDIPKTFQTTFIW